MARALLSLMIVVTELVVADLSFGRPPDKVVDSPIPPIEAPLPRRSQRGAASEATTRDGRTPLIVPDRFNLGTQPLPPVMTPTVQASGKSSVAAVAQDAAQRNSVRAVNPPAGGSQAVEDGNTNYYSTTVSEFWDSPPMLEARKGVMGFSRRSAHTTEAEGEQFLARLSQSSLGEMKSWLERYQSRQADLSFGREVGQLARRMMLDEAISRQEATRRAYENVSRMRDEAAVAQQQNAIEQAQAVQFNRDRRRDQQMRIIGLGPIYNPLEPVLDPMSPQGYRRRVAAAMSLPGDLPAGDPRNFIRGEEGIDTGEWTNRPDSEPPAGPAPATPAPASPAPATPAAE